MNINNSKNKALIEENERLDRYFTKPIVASQCYQYMRKLLIDTGKDLDSIIFIEPSAGSGNFLNAIMECKAGFDVVPILPSIIQNDFLKNNFTNKLSTREKEKNIVFIGNPPFGNRAHLAIDFVNKALSYSNVVGFILPLQFRKWSVQSKINKNARLIMDIDLDANAFEFMGKDYKVRCSFQVWSLDSFSADYKDLRISKKPRTDHPHFEMYQYNRTEEAKKFFDYDWDFAVPRQGFCDYTLKVYDKKDCDLKKQWILFKAKDKKTLKKLVDLDFVKISQKNISIPGFGKADVIQEYKKQYNE
jgi:hypothetical protein